jgi:hypothetical protein
MIKIKAGIASSSCMIRPKGCDILLAYLLFNWYKGRSAILSADLADMNDVYCVLLPENHNSHYCGSQFDSFCKR